MAKLQHAILKTNPHISKGTHHSNGNTLTIEFPPGHTYFKDLFDSEAELETVDMTELVFPPDAEINMAGMFYECTKLREVTFFTSDTITRLNAEAMFFGCCNMETIDMSTIHVKVLEMCDGTFDTDCPLDTVVLPHVRRIVSTSNMPIFRFAIVGTVVIPNEEPMWQLDPLFAYDYDGHITIEMSESFFNMLESRDYDQLPDDNYTIVLTS